MKLPRLSSALLSGAVTALILTGGSCITIGGSGTSNTGTDGGVFKTVNRGDAWTQKVAIPTVSGQPRSIGAVNVTTIVQDPNDPAALYIGTTENGMFYTFDAGESWFQPSQLSRGRIPAVAVDPKDKCTVYVAIENKLLKSTDCTRTWAVTYLDTRVDKLTVSVVVDFYNPNVVWIANNSGDVLRSNDGGGSWANVRSFATPVLKIAMSTADSRKLYVATKSAGVWRTDDGGANWSDLSLQYKDFSGSNEFLEWAFGVSDPNTVVIATRYGLLRSNDGGNKWQSVDLLTPPGTTLIYSVALDPKDVNNLYYGTSTLFYRSPNGGVNWVTKKLPSSRSATALIVDRTNQDVLYLGLTRFKQ